MGDMADALTEQGQDELWAHNAGQCDYGCPYCRITPVPKPKKKRKAKSRPARTAKPKRIARTARLKRGTKKIPKVNPAKQAKRRRGYRVKLAAYRRSVTYKLVEARAGGRCERVMTMLPWPHEQRCHMRRDGEGVYFAFGAKQRLTHHHKTYARFGGKELPSDIELLCDAHHAEEEAKHPTRHRNYR